ncbi:MAG: hypothetical protein M0R46_16770 [Candidatus Muirbacterium halophilum]|nr:hypothetical protein [Candidatus Muirbacterium halophilum]
MSKKIIIGNIFDGGGEFEQGFQESIKNLGGFSREPIEKFYSEYFIKLKLYPYKVSIENIKIKFENKEFEANIYAKIFPYGAIIISAEIDVELNSFEELFNIFWMKDICLESNTCELREYFKCKFDYILEKLKNDIKIDYKSPEFIDEYRIIVDDNDMDNEDVMSLLMNDIKKCTNKDLENAIFFPDLGYLEGEKVVVTPKNAYIRYNKSEVDVILSLVELGYTQVYELKVYDYLLDNFIETLYNEVENYKFKNSLIAPSIFSKKYTRLIKNAVSLLELRVDIVDLIRDISNALKVTEDVYYSYFYSKVIEKVKFNQWYENINIKLEEIEKFNALLREEGDVVRSAKLEFWIILLFVIEIVLAFDFLNPFTYTVVQQFLENIKNLF